jgi:hypothetical protein
MWYLVWALLFYIAYVILRVCEAENVVQALLSVLYLIIIPAFALAVLFLLIGKIFKGSKVSPQINVELKDYSLSKRSKTETKRLTWRDANFWNPMGQYPKTYYDKNGKRVRVKRVK